MTTLKQQKTRRDIIFAMKTLMNEKSFENITIKLICETAMIHHSTFYRYFRDKYELLKAVLATLCDDIDVRLNDGQTIGTASLEIIKQEQALFEHLGGYQQDSGFYNNFLTGMSTLILEHAQNPNDRKHDPLLKLVSHSNNMEMASYAVAGAMIGLIVRWSNETSVESTEILQSFVEQMYQSLAQVVTDSARLR